MARSRYNNWCAGGREAIDKRVQRHCDEVGPRIDELRAQGETWQTIAGYLIESGIPSPSEARDTRSAGPWTAKAVRRIHDRRHAPGAQLGLPIGNPTHQRLQQIARQAKESAHQLTLAHEHDLAHRMDHLAALISTAASRGETE